MVKREKKKKLHGSVLLTVVIVMSLLIVFLFGTLALATAANNRAHVNYSSAQTRVTSRLVAESALKAVSKDSDYAFYIGNIGDPSGTNNKGESLNMVSGGQVAVKIQGVNENAMGNISPVKVDWVGKSKYYDAIEEDWIERDVLRFTADVTLGGVTSSSSVYVLKHYDRDEEPKPPGRGPGFSTTGSADLTCQTSIVGGAYVNMPTLQKANYYGAENYDYANRARYTEGFSAYDSGNPSGTALILDKGGTMIEADLYVYHNLYFNDASYIVFPDKSTGITVWGDLAFSSNATAQLKYHFGARAQSDKLNEDMRFNEIPYVFVDGCIDGTNGAIMIGEESDDAANVYPLNVFCGNIMSGKSANKKTVISGDIYCMNPYESSYLGNEDNDQSAKLYNWSYSVVNQTMTPPEYVHSANSVYSKGNMTLQKIKIGRDVRIEGDCIIKNGVEIGGNLVVGGNLIMESTPIVGGSIITASSSNDDYVEVETVYHDPAPMPGRTYYEIPNQTRKYYKYDLSSAPTEIIDWIPFVLDPWGNPMKKSDGNYISIYDWNAFNTEVYFYKLNDDFNPSASLMFPENLDSYSIDEIKDYLDPNPVVIAKNDVDSGSFSETYYVETYINESGAAMVGANGVVYADPPIYDLDGEMTNIGYYSTSVKTSSPVTYYDSETHETLKAYRTFKDASGNDTGKLSYPQDATKVWIDKTTNEQVSEEELAASVKPASEVYGQSIYPEYAEKSVILGIDAVGSTPKSETKIVKTIREVVESTGIYSNDFRLDDVNKMPKELKNLYIKDGLETAPYLYNTAEVTSFMENGLSPVYLKSYETGDGHISITTTASAGEKNNNALFINKSCKLDMSIANGEYKNVIIDPGDEDIIIVVKKLLADSQVNIYVNDAGSGSVSFIVEHDGEMKVGDNANFCTQGYFNFEKDYANKAVKYNCKINNNMLLPGIEGATDLSSILGNATKPRINVYSEKAEGSEVDPVFDISNFKWISANVKAPNMYVRIAATSDGITFNDFYYNDYDFSNVSGHKNWVFGCLNAKDVITENLINVVYIDDNNGGGGGSSDANKEFWYKALYYDEY